MLYVVGIGPGDKNYLIELARSIVEEAEIVIGGKRNIETLGIKNKKVFFIGANLEEMKAFIIENKEKTQVVLASGDPSIYGIGSYIVRELKEDVDIEIIPGISSIQYAFSKFKIDMNDTFISSSHGREPDYDFLFKHKKIAMVTDKKNGPYEIAEEIKNRNLDFTIYVGEKLSYPDECFTKGNYKEIMKRREYNMSVVILVENNS